MLWELWFSVLSSKPWDKQACVILLGNGIGQNGLIWASQYHHHKQQHNQCKPAIIRSGTFEITQSFFNSLQLQLKFLFDTGSTRNCIEHVKVILTRPLTGVESTISLHLSICLSVITSNTFPYSDSKLTQPPPVDLSQATSPTVSNVPHPCPPCPPVNWSTNANGEDHVTNLSFPLGVELCVNLTFFL